MRGGDIKREVGKGAIPKENTGGVRDAGARQPQTRGKAKLKLHDIAKLISSEDWRQKAVKNLRGKMFAKSTLASKASKRKNCVMRSPK